MPTPSERTQPGKQRSIIYIDGFNLYYRCLKPLGMQWLDLQAFFTRLRKDDHIVKIRYFTAPLDGTKYGAHQTYLRAIQTLPLVEISLGKYQTQHMDCEVAECGYLGERRFFKYKEKRTDVNIALHMLDDAHKNDCDIQVLVSGDSDLVPAVQMVKDGYGKKVVLYVPVSEEIPLLDDRRYVATELRRVATMARDLPFRTLDRAQFPDEIVCANGEIVRKDLGW